MTDEDCLSINVYKTVKELNMVDHWKRYHLGTTSDIMNLLDISLRTFFTSEQTLCEQINGTPMGSLTSGLMAEIVLQQLET